RAGGEVEAQLDLGAGHVDVLTARTARARGAHAQLGGRDHQPRADLEVAVAHGLATWVPRSQARSRRAARARRPRATGPPPARPETRAGRSGCRPARAARTGRRPGAPRRERARARARGPARWRP